MGSHQQPIRGENDVWLTPLAILFALGSFDLDPCACPEPRPWSTARRHIALPDDGLTAEWNGRIWCNPPYGDEAAAWLERMTQHQRGTALIFARTETEAWTRFVWPVASAILFIAGRLTFYLPDGTRAKSNSGAPSTLIAYGQDDAEALRLSGIEGSFVPASRIYTLTPEPKQTAFQERASEFAPAGS